MATAPDVMHVAFNAARFGAWLRGECAQIEITTGRQLAKLIDSTTPAELDQKTVARWFNGDNSPRPAQLRVLFDALGTRIPPDDLKKSFDEFLRSEVARLRAWVARESNPEPTDSQSAATPGLRVAAASKGSRRSSRASIKAGRKLKSA